MSIAVVKAADDFGDHCPLLLYAGTGESAMQAEQSSYGYEITRRRYDGVIDTTGFEDAECDDEPACACCMHYIDHWESEVVPVD